MQTAPLWLVIVSLSVLIVGVSSGYTKVVKGFRAESRDWREEVIHKSVLLQTVLLLQTPTSSVHYTVLYISGEIHVFIIKCSRSSVEVKFPSISFWVPSVALGWLLPCRCLCGFPCLG